MQGAEPFETEAGRDGTGTLPDRPPKETRWGWGWWHEKGQVSMPAGDRRDEDDRAGKEVRATASKRTEQKKVITETFDLRDK